MIQLTCIMPSLTQSLVGMHLARCLIGDRIDISIQHYQSQFTCLFLCLSTILVKQLVQSSSYQLISHSFSNLGLIYFDHNRTVTWACNNLEEQSIKVSECTLDIEMWTLGWIWTQPGAQVLEYLHVQISLNSCRVGHSIPTMAGETLTLQL